MEILTYIKKDPDLIFTALEDILLDDLVELFGFSGLDRDFYNIDFFEGAIEIRQGTVKLMGLKYYYSVIDAWSCLLNMSEDILIKQQEYSVYTLPDKPAPIIMEKITPERIRLTMDEEFIDVSLKDFFQVLFIEAEKFFSAMNQFFKDLQGRTICGSRTKKK